MPLVVDTFKAGTIEATQSITINGQTIGGDGWITETIEVSSAEILNLGSQDVELLPAPGENKYYTWYGVLEFFPGSNTYSVSGPLLIKMDKSNYTVDVDLESENINIATFNVFLDGTGSFELNKNVTLDYAGVSAITSGDGTLKVKITYKINEI
jgi:hypothetical protein